MQYGFLALLILLLRYFACPVVLSMLRHFFDGKQDKMPLREMIFLRFRTFRNSKQFKSSMNKTESSPPVTSNAAAVILI